MTIKYEMNFYYRARSLSRYEYKGRLALDREATQHQLKLNFVFLDESRPAHGTFQGSFRRLDAWWNRDAWIDGHLMEYSAQFQDMDVKNPEPLPGQSLADYLIMREMIARVMRDWKR